ncbi:MAG TPA: putative zinc-binding metallopeptidase [Fontimonas sp.]
MKRFRCDRCQSLVVFENDRCVNCDSRLAYVPERREMLSWGAMSEDAAAIRDVGAPAASYRLCRNYLEHNICNWTVAIADGVDLCLSCRLTAVIPDLQVTDNLSRWFRIEAAKRRVIAGLLGLSLPLDAGGAAALRFEFKADQATPGGIEPVLTGHSQGVITVNIAEADDAERERRRVTMHEPYRTLVGHFRHELGHYYWDCLIAPTRRLHGFRKLFGDERADYSRALASYYSSGPVADWQQGFISAYASAHPWEDWAETWAHYLHMLDSLETAHEGGLSLRPERRSDPSFPHAVVAGSTHSRAFDKMLDRWRSLTYILNELNRALGLRDAYPFVLSDAVNAKLEFVHRTVERCRKVG